MMYDLLIVGAGACGIRCAVEAKKNGIDKVLIVEHEESPGGILNDIIESEESFGSDGMTGVELAADLTRELIESGVDIKVNTRVLSIEKDKTATLLSPERGLEVIQAKSVILATGGRERPRGILNFTSKRTAGIFSVGTVRKFILNEGYLPGKNIAIYGADLTGLYLARLLLIEGADKVTIIEQSKEVKILDEQLKEFFEVNNVVFEPGRVITEIHGNDRIEAVILEKNASIPGERLKKIECDALVLSVGLSSQKTLARKFKREPEENGLFIAGNAKKITFNIQEIFEDASQVALKVKEYLKNVSGKERES